MATTTRATGTPMFVRVSLEDIRQNGVMAPNDDIKARMKQALDAKHRTSQQGTPHGKAPTEGKTHEHPDREGGNREFRRRKSG